MGYFKKINLENFRNFDTFEVEFESSCNVFVGQNGSGKTNLLECISLFEKGRGFRKESIYNLINFKSTTKKFNIKSNFIDNNITLKIDLIGQDIENEQIKKLFVNGNSSKENINYFQDKLALIFFLPEMERLFLNSPSMRRNFFDRLIYNTDKTYNKLLNKYKKCINERHQILKGQNYDIDWVKSLEKQITNYGIDIYKKRIEHLRVINSNFKEIKNYKKHKYDFFFSIKDNLLNNYDDNFEKLYENYITELSASRSLDSIIGGCKIGPHKSDIIGYDLASNININQFSTGQQKTIILLIIIAQCKYLINVMKINPIILFDEVCSHLDNNNRELLLDIIESLKVQTFITGTEKNFFSFLTTKGTYFNIK